MSFVRHLALVAVVAVAFACGSDDDNGGADPDASTDCTLPVEVISCTVGEDAPCTAECPEAFCRSFMHTGGACTSTCGDADDCPDGWSCNNMGICRPPG